PAAREFRASQPRHSEHAGAPSAQRHTDGAAAESAEIRPDDRALDPRDPGLNGIVAARGADRLPRSAGKGRPRHRHLAVAVLGDRPYSPASYLSQTRSQQPLLTVPTPGA